MTVMGRFAEAELLPISGLQHLVFCERQFALIHVECVWIENSLTAEGREIHQRVQGGVSESRGEIRVARNLQIHSLTYGLVGRADVVEFHRDTSGVGICGLAGHWRPIPIEYKRGRPKLHRADEVQLGAQAMCLEEMLDVAVPLGFLFYGRTRRRLEVPIDDELRSLVRKTLQRARDLIEQNLTPQARREPKCERCSLLDVCRPDAAERSVRRFLERELASASGEFGD